MLDFLTRLFSSRPSRRHIDPDATAQVLAAMHGLAEPTLVLDAGQGEDLVRLGGLPRLPENLTWPMRDGRPLSFLAEMDLAAIRAAGGPDVFPERGFLHIFYDLLDSPWGFDPRDAEGFAILWSDVVSAEPADRPLGLADEALLAPRMLRGRRALSYPTPERLNLATGVVSASDFDAAWTLERSETGDGVQHRIGGLPSPIQGDHMELEADQASLGVYMGDGKGYAAAGDQGLERARREWMLLLQIDTDEEAGMMWGDMGRLYVWVRRDDLRQGRFDRAWIIQQCS